VKPARNQVRRLVERRAGHRCEYCHIRCQDEPFFRFHIDHIIARQHGGGATPDNLALACHFCNRRKGPNLSAIDPITGHSVALFHPRRDKWSDHFRQIGRRITGLTPAGRATVALLQMNAANRLALRTS